MYNVRVLNLNLMTNYCIRKTILNEDGRLSVYTTKYVLCYIYIAIKVIYLTISNTLHLIKYSPKTLHLKMPLCI